MQFMHLNDSIRQVWQTRVACIYIYILSRIYLLILLQSKAIAIVPLFPLYGQQADKNARKTVRPTIDNTTIVPLRRYITDACAIFPYVGPRSA